MNNEELLQNISAQCDAFKTLLSNASDELAEFTRRLTLILSRLHKENDTRDEGFSAQFNQFTLDLRAQIDGQETFWSSARQQARAAQTGGLSGLALAAKGFNSRAKTLSRACDEFSTAYHTFYKTYQSYTAHKLNVWLLTSCDADINNLTGKILFLARETARAAERARER